MYGIRSRPDIQPYLDPQPSAASRAPKHIPFIDGEIFDVKAGSTNQIFHVHGEVLAASPFLRKAMKKEWTKEVKNIRPAKNHIDLTPHSPYIVRTYIQWLYSRNIPDEATATDLVDLYVFGDEMMHNEFLNAILDTLVSSDNTTPFTIELIHKIYERTKKNSPLRRLAIDSFARNGSLEDGTAGSIHAEVGMDLLRASMKLRNPFHMEPPFDFEREHYHHALEGVTERT